MQLHMNTDNANVQFFLMSSEMAWMTECPNVGHLIENVYVMRFKLNHVQK